MRYICPICGYIYDEAAEGVPFDSLPDSWSCPLCGAPKLMFEPEAAPEPPKAQPEAAPLAAGDDLQQLSAGALAALCSNLARGCEKHTRRRKPPFSARSRTFTQPPRRRWKTRTLTPWRPCCAPTWTAATPT